MNLPHHRDLKQSAAAAVDAAPHSKKIVLIWGGASALLSLAVSILNLVLDHQIAGTGGLSGIGLRSMLSTAQTILALSTVLVGPFWALGYDACILGISRNQEVRPGRLLEGFRRFGPVLRLQVLQFFLYFAVMLGAFYLSAALLSATPLALPLMDFVVENQEQLLSGAVDEATSLAMAEAMTPILIISGIACAAALIPIYYRLRFAPYVLLDGSGSAMAAMLLSNRLLRRRCFRLLRLDLSFWWYYLLTPAALLLSYGDWILAALGIPLPLSPEVASFAFYLVGLLAQLTVLYLWGNRVKTSYAAFYNALAKDPGATLPTPGPAPM